MSSRPRPATTTTCCSTANVVPTPARASSRKGIRGPSQVVDTGAFEWTAEPPRVAPEDLVVYEMHVGCFTGEGTFDARDRVPGRPRRARRHRDRGDAGRRLPRAARLGLRRDLRLRAVRPLRRAGGPGPLRRRRPRGGPGGDPRLRLQPPRHLRHESDDRLRPLLHRRPPDRLGQGPELRRRQVGPGARMGDPERRDVGARLPDRRPAAGRGARDPRREPDPPGRRADRAGPCHPRGCDGDRREQRERSRHHPARRARAAGASTRSGPTTSTIRCGRC